MGSGFVIYDLGPKGVEILPVMVPSMESPNSPAVESGPESCDIHEFLRVISLMTVVRLGTRKVCPFCPDSGPSRWETDTTDTHPGTGNLEPKKGTLLS